MGLTLAQYKTRLYDETGLDKSKLPTERAGQLLNLGWAHAVEDVGGYGELIRTATVVGQEEYELPARVIDVENVMIMQANGTDILVRPRRVRFTKISEGASATKPGIPMVWSWAVREYDLGAPKKILRLWPAPNTAVDNGLQVNILRVPDFLTTDASECAVPDALAEAGFQWAKFLVTDKPTAKMLYDETIGLWNRSNPAKRVRAVGRTRYARGMWLINEHDREA